MPIVQANTGAKVLVTGANGYVAVSVVQNFWGKDILSVELYSLL